MHPKYELTGIRTQIMENTFHVPESLTLLTTEPSGTSFWPDLPYLAVTFEQNWLSCKRKLS